MKAIKNEVKQLPKNQLLKKLPAAPVYLSTASKKHWKNIGKRLIDAEVLKSIHLSGLEILADAQAQFEWSVKEISKKNKDKYGSGFIMTHGTGAQNVSVEVTLKNAAIKTMMQSLKQFGLDPKSEKELNIEPSQQLDLFAQLTNNLSKTS